MHEQCANCGATDPEIIIGIACTSGGCLRQVLCLQCAFEDSEVLRYLGEIAVRNAAAREAPEEPNDNGPDTATRIPSS